MNKKKLEERLRWLLQKEAAMCDPNGTDYTLQHLLRGRIQGEIGGIRWALRELDFTV